MVWTVPGVAVVCQELDVSVRGKWMKQKGRLLAVSSWATHAVAPKPWSLWCAVIISSLPRIGPAGNTTCNTPCVMDWAQMSYLEV